MSIGNRDLANQIENASGKLLNRAIHIIKEENLKKLPNNLGALHKQRKLWIHDLEYYDIAHNCLGISVLDTINDKNFKIKTVVRKLLREIINITNEQSGGIGFINFDEDMAFFLKDETIDDLKEYFSELFSDLNLMLRKGSEKAYVTFNFGLDTSHEGRVITKAILKAFEAGDEYGNPFIFPNLVFKVKEGINKNKEDVNYDLFLKSLKVTSKSMIPTYFNCDAEENRGANPKEIGIMGCRTRVVENLNGNRGAKNRGNIACVTLNLAQLAYESKNIEEYYINLDILMENSKEILLHRRATLNKEYDFSYFIKNDLIIHNKGDIQSALDNGTLSIGFIGLWEAVSYLLNEELSKDLIINFYDKLPYSIVEKMREKVDIFSKKNNLNFSLIASSSEGVTGQFAKYDSLNFREIGKEFYTNSFHVPVNIKMNYFEKLKYEGIYHRLCNGGSISYVELKEIPQFNVEGLEELVKFGINQDCNYLGINFPLDRCKKCGKTGRIDNLCSCGSNDILRLRRVSGYLGEVNKLTKGKYEEMKERCYHD